MRVITIFPEQFELLNEQVAEVTIIHALSPDEHDAATLALIAEQGWDQDYRAVEFWIVLNDGRTFGFMAATPEYLRDYLDRENLLSFVSLGLLVVSQITEQALLDALENSLSQATRYEVDSLGYRMSSSHNHSDEDDNYTP